MYNMKRKHYLKPKKQRDLALEKITLLFKEAISSFKTDPKTADKNVKLARKTAMTFKVKIPLKFKRRFCKNCYSFLLPGKNCRIRTNKGNIVYYCLNCKGFTRIGYKSKISSKK